MHLCLVALLAVTPLAGFAPDESYTLTIQDHRFEPAELRVPAGRKLKVVIQNQDATAEEFDSHALNREKVVPGKSAASVFIGPLKPGRYPFVGEFHEATAQGVVVAE
jgi:plastocyanin